MAVGFKPDQPADGVLPGGPWTHVPGPAPPGAQQHRGSVHPATSNSERTRACPGACGECACRLGDGPAECTSDRPGARLGGTSHERASGSGQPGHPDRRRRRTCGNAIRIRSKSDARTRSCGSGQRASFADACAHLSRSGSAEPHTDRRTSEHPASGAACHQPPALNRATAGACVHPRSRTRSRTRSRPGEHPVPRPGSVHLSPSSCGPDLPVHRPIACARPGAPEHAGRSSGSEPSGRQHPECTGRAHHAFHQHPGSGGLPAAHAATVGGLPQWPCLRRHGRCVAPARQPGSRSGCASVLRPGACRPLCGSHTGACPRSRATGPCSQQLRCSRPRPGPGVSCPRTRSGCDARASQSERVCGAFRHEPSCHRTRRRSRGHASVRSTADAHRPGSSTFPRSCTRCRPLRG